MRVRQASFVSAIFFSLFICSTAYGQTFSIPDTTSNTNMGGQNTIIGTVFGPSGRPIEARVRVKLSSMTAGDRYVNTNENGGYRFSGLPTGGYTISVDREKEYEPVSQTVDIMQFRGAPAQTMTVNLRLTPKGSTEAKPGVVNAEFAAAPPAAQEHFKKAGELIKAENRKGAIEELRLAISVHPKFSLAYNEIGIQYIKLNDLDSAAAAFRDSLKVNPENFDAHLNLGVIYYTQKKFAEAETELRAANKLRENTPGVRYYLGMSVANLGKFDEAETELQAAIKLGGPEMKEAHRVLSIIYGARGDNKKSLKELEAYVKLAPDAVDIEQLKARIAQLKGKS
jgi:Flp pilus assembly protein TadD